MVQANVYRHLTDGMAQRTPQSQAPNMQMRD
jgi:hypothetical protein